MPIVARRGRVVAEPRSRLLRFERPAGVAVVAGAVGSPTQLADPDPGHELARLALDVVVRTAEPRDLPHRWAGHAFAREVDRTRGQLEPIRSRAGLIASFSREASIGVTPDVGATGQPPGPVRVAYALRWLELGDGRRRPAWSTFVSGAARDVIALAARGERSGLSVAPPQRIGEITR